MPSLGQSCRALEFVAIADTEEAGSVYNSFIAFKVHLEEGDSAGACQELANMMGSPDFSEDFLTVRGCYIPCALIFLSSAAVQAR